MQARAARSRNDGVGIAVEPLLLTEIRGRCVDPDERVLVAGNSLELTGKQRFVALNNRLAIDIHRYDPSIGTRLHLFFPAASFLFMPETLASVGCHVVRTTRNSAFPLILRA